MLKSRRQLTKGNKVDVFSNALKRSEILNYAKNLDFSSTQSITINIHRNHAFEPMQSVIAPFLHHSNLKANFCYSDYDDSLSFANYKQSDLEIIFLDISRYALSQDECISFLKERCEVLKSLSNAPILVLLLDPNNNPQAYQTLKSQNVFVFTLNVLYSAYCQLSLQTKPLLDEAKESITGSKLSNSATLALAQILGLKYIPSLILPNLKAIVLDLDNTLYEGILGEDGKENLHLSKEHKALQELLLDYKKQGYLLAIASKNEEEDAKLMFQARSDFPLQWNDFDCIKVNWENKAQNLQEIAQTFNIGIDSMLFVDDNIAEIESTKHTKIQQIHAKTPLDALFALFLYPRLYKFQTSKEDALRSRDIAANATRSSLESLTDEDYFKNLAIHLKFRINLKEDAQRIYELMNKTNQFIANYTRPNIHQVQEWLQNENFCIISIAMSDRLSDSGIIGIIIGEKTLNPNPHLQILDLVISCRALGRRLEKIMLLQAFELIKNQLDPSQKEIFIHYQKGERNAPFLRLIETLAFQQSILLPSKLEESKGLLISIQRNSQ